MCVCDLHVSYIRHEGGSGVPGIGWHDEPIEGEVPDGTEQDESGASGPEVLVDGQVADEPPGCGEGGFRVHCVVAVGRGWACERRADAWPLAAWVAVGRSYRCVALRCGRKITKE